MASWQHSSRRAPGALATVALGVGVAGAILIVLAVPRPARATEVGYGRSYGLGLILGDTTGLSAKAWVGPTNAIDAGLGAYGYGFRGGCVGGPDGRPLCDRGPGQRLTSLHADYLWQAKLLQRTVQLDWHVGGGVRALLLGSPCRFDCWDLGVRLPIGLDLTFVRPSFVEVFLELAPSLYVAPVAFLAFEGGLGVRFYF
jgi:hypothetical protein